MKSFFLTLLIAWVTACCGLAQNGRVITGTVLDSKTKKPLVNAGIGIAGKSFGTESDSGGNFGLMISDAAWIDTLFVSYVGYKPYRNRVANLDTMRQVFLLEETPTILDEITILTTKSITFDIRKLEASMKLVKGNLYACSTEVTNRAYNQFLTHLIRSGQQRLYEKYKPDLHQYEGSLLAFFRGNGAQQLASEKTKYNKDYDDYPIVNITHEAAVAYTEWLTESYNDSKGKKKFEKVRFRLPALKEWQIAALGYPKFQSWEFEENIVAVWIPQKPGDEIGVKKRPLPVRGNEILYPWFSVFDYRNRAQNRRNCWFGNFKVPAGSTSCYVWRANGDGFSITGKVASYFPNEMGLFDVVGNVGEMIDERGKACGGSWDDAPETSTILSIHPYSGPSGSVGFRVFMEVNSD